MGRRVLEDQYSGELLYYTGNFDHLATGFSREHVFVKDWMPYNLSGSTDALNESVRNCVTMFGGLDIVVSNAGIFSQGNYIEKLDDADWQRSLNLNLSQHKNLMHL